MTVSHTVDGEMTADCMVGSNISCGLFICHSGFEFEAKFALHFRFYTFFYINFTICMSIIYMQYSMVFAFNGGMSILYKCAFSIYWP